MRLVAAWRSNDPTNLGDRMCSPSLYYPWLRGAERIDLWEQSVGDHIQPGEHVGVVVGGGGLIAFGLGPSGNPRDITFDSNLEALSQMDLAGPLIMWGAGHQGLNLGDLTFPAYMDRFSMVGIRDWLTGDAAPAWYHWVPDPSVLHSAFDRPYAPEHDVVIYEHAHHPITAISDPSIPRLDNTEQDLSRVIDFFKGADVVITTSFHGAYWATCAGSRVIVVDPFATKFLTMRHAPAIVDDAARWREGLNGPGAARRHPEALADCREANAVYASMVQQRLELAAASPEAGRALRIPGPVPEISVRWTPAAQRPEPAAPQREDPNSRRPQVGSPPDDPSAPPQAGAGPGVMGATAPPAETGGAASATSGVSRVVVPGRVVGIVPSRPGGVPGPGLPAAPPPSPHRGGDGPADPPDLSQGLRGRVLPPAPGDVRGQPHPLRSQAPQSITERVEAPWSPRPTPDPGPHPMRPGAGRPGPGIG